MGMTEGRASLRKSVKELMMHWAETKSNWTRRKLAHALRNDSSINLIRMRSRR